MCLNPFVESRVFWWQRDDLRMERGRLRFCGRDVASFVEPIREPVFLYDGNRAVDNLARVDAALVAAGINRRRVYFAMKANRFRPLLSHLRQQAIYGVDVCSKEELLEALACGFSPARISYTAHGMSREDARLLAAYPEVLVNCDTLAAIRLMGELAPGREIGLRINPAQGVGYADSERLSYAGEQTTKFGIYREQLNEAIASAREYGLAIKALHCHAGCGYLNPQLESLERVLVAIEAFMDVMPDIELVNIGGGLGVAHREADQTLNLDEWARLIRSTVFREGVEIAVEPGDYAVKDAGLLVLRVNYVEQKRDTLFIGVNGGFNLAPEPVFYDLPCIPVPCVPRSGVERRATVAGNINEALDIWVRNAELAPLREGDLLALLNAGGYSSSMSSNHCMQGSFREFLFV